MEGCAKYGGIRIKCYATVTHFCFLVCFGCFFLGGGTSLSHAGNLGCLTCKAQQVQKQRYPFLLVSAVFSCVQTMVWLPMLRIFNMHTDVDACSFTRGWTNVIRESALKADSGEKIPCRAWDVNPHQYCIWLLS